MLRAFATRSVTMSSSCGAGSPISLLERLPPAQVAGPGVEVLAALPGELLIESPDVLEKVLEFAQGHRFTANCLAILRHHGDAFAQTFLSLFSDVYDIAPNASLPTN